MESSCAVRKTWMPSLGCCCSCMTHRVLVGDTDLSSCDRTNCFCQGATQRIWEGVSGTSTQVMPLTGSDTPTSIVIVWGSGPPGKSHVVWPQLVHRAATRTQLQRSGRTTRFAIGLLHVVWLSRNIDPPGCYLDSGSSGGMQLEVFSPR